MLCFLQAGLVAASRQLIAVVVVTLGASLLASHNLIDQKALASGIDGESFWTSASTLLIWAYLLIAAGLALTSNRYVDLTAERIRRASRLVRLVGERGAAKMLAFQFGLSAVMFATFALRTPPEFLLEAGRYFGHTCVASIAWSGTMSIGVACFGAIAHAAVSAHRSQSLSR